ncbi:hypothetical protein BDN72DRAFT_893698 [Pluteus cervinus]|uniref:Uncharacterized protein n=1 Tax=Pluteus cervinus TaxID=181527 RepID=A0ACD3B6I4_9AGAR|nr:hypothetical protein BDN72DRAFT_893698 [Pluteus cervinus]
MSETPSWPSLYSPGIEILHIEHRDPIQPGAFYLKTAHDTFVFTLYWTLILYLPVFFLCGLYAFFNLNFPPSKLRHSRILEETTLATGAINFPPSPTYIQSTSTYTSLPTAHVDQFIYPPSPVSPMGTTRPLLHSIRFGNKRRGTLTSTKSYNPQETMPRTMRETYAPVPVKPAKPKERRSRLTFSLLVLMTYLILGVASSVIGSAVLGYTVMGIYRAGGYNMST